MWDHDGENGVGLKLGGLAAKPVPPEDAAALQRACDESIAHREKMAHAEAMADALGNCKGFSLFSIYLLHIPPRRGGSIDKDSDGPSWTENKMFSLLAFAAFALLVAQWLAPITVGFHIFTSIKVDRELCARSGSIETKLLMSAISAIYFTKLYVRFYPRMTIRDHFVRYGFNVAWMIPSNTWIYDLGMPSAWREAYIADIVLTDTIYDTLVYLFNLALIFVTDDPLEMVLNTVAFEFFTMLDDEFKAVALERIVERTYIQIYFTKMRDNPNYWVEKAQDPERRFRKVTNPCIIAPAFTVMYAGLLISSVGIIFGPICK